MTAAIAGLARMATLGRHVPVEDPVVVFGVAVPNARVMPGPRGIRDRTLRTDGSIPVALAEEVGPASNRLHLDDNLITCFQSKSKGAPAGIGDAFNEDRRLHRHVFGFSFIAVEQGNVGQWAEGHIDEGEV